MTRDQGKSTSDVNATQATGAACPRPLPPERFEREPEPTPKTALDRLIRLIAA